jgi:hypothetical protein
VPLGTVTVGGVPELPAGDRSAAAIGPMATGAPPVGDAVGEAGLVVEVEVVPAEELEGVELQAARPNAPATPSVASRRAERAVGRGRGIGRDGSR